MCLAQGPRRSDAGEARTRGPSVSSQALYHWATALPTSSTKGNKEGNIRNRYNRVRHLIQDTNGKVTNLQLDITNESQEVSPFPEGDHKATINRRAQKHTKHTTEILWMIH